MKVVIEKEEAGIMQFDTEKDYIVLKNFVSYDILGFAKVSFNDGILYAELDLKTNIKGFPAIGLNKDTNTGLCTLDCIGICDSPNLDESIEQIEYTLQLEGKPSNLKTK